MKDGFVKAIFSRCSKALSSEKKHEREQMGQEIHELQDVLTGIKARLGDLCSSSENDFLDLGKKLQSIHTRSTAMSELASEVLKTMSGSEINDAVTGLSHILDELEVHLGTSESGFDKISKGLNEYLSTLGKVTSNLEKFRMLVLNLNVLGFFTRVEDAHILRNDTGFSSLTNDVKSLSQRILEKSSQIQEKSRTLSVLIARALADFLKYRKSHRAQAEAMLNGSVSNHEILVARHDTATGTAHLIASKSRKIMDRIGDIVTSLQFNDITTQQIAHVLTVLDTLPQSIDTGNLSETEEIGIISEVCSLQSAQLKNTREEVGTAVERVIVDMEAISRHILELLDETRKVTWASDIEGLTFMEELDSGISTVIESLNENISEQIGLTNTMSAVSSMVSEMSVFVEEIENLGLSLQLIALNARIKAAHIGNEGAALDTISGSIYELSKDSRTDTNVLSNMLASVVDIADHFNTELKELQSGQEQHVASLVKNLKALLNAIHDMNDSVFGSLIQMNSLGEALVEDIGETVSGVTINMKVKEVLGKIVLDMEEIHEKSKLLCPQTDNSNSSSFVKELEKYYTMESEFRVHAGHEGSGGSLDVPVPCGETVSEYGDNVELF